MKTKVMQLAVLLVIFVVTAYAGPGRSDRSTRLPAAHSRCRLWISAISARP